MRLIKRHFLIFIFFGFLLSLIFLTYQDYGVPWDEKIFFNTGKYFVVKIFDVLNIPTNLSTNGFEPTTYHVKGHGVFMDMLTVFIAFLFPGFTFETLHLIRAFLAIPIFILLYWIVNRLLNKRYALLSLIFLLLSPRFYAEIFYNAVDIPTTLLFTISLAYFIYYAKTKQTALQSILFGLLLAITINQRLLLFYLPALNTIFLFFKRKSLNSFLTSQFLILTSLFFFLHLTHPYLLSHPITGIIDIIIHAKQYPWNAAVLFEGKFFSNLTIPLPWYYLPKTMLITIPLITLFLFLIGSIRVLYLFFKNRLVGKDSLTPEVKYLFSIFYLPLILNFIFKPTLYDSWRQFLFLTIPMIIIAMYGLGYLVKLYVFDPQLKTQNSKLKATTQNLKLLKKINFEFLTVVLRFALLALIFINLFFTAKEMLILHPYQYLYYNSLVGGFKGAYGKYETDYWGLAFKEATLWFKKNVNDPKKQYKIFVEGDPLSSSYYFEKNMQLTTDPLTADYVFAFTRWDFDKRHLGKTVHIIKKETVPLIYIKRGGRLIEELNTR